MRVAVLGAGYAGVVAARRLEDRLPDDVDLVVVDENGEHLVQHEVHRVIRRPSLAEEISIPLTEVLNWAEIRTQRVTGLDPEAGVAQLADGSTLEYDVGILAIGAETAFYDLPGVEEHGLPLKTVDHARAIRETFLSVCEIAPPAEDASPGDDVGADDVDEARDEPIRIDVDDVVDGDDPGDLDDDSEDVDRGTGDDPEDPVDVGDPGSDGPDGGSAGDAVDPPDLDPVPDADVPRVVVGGAGLSGVQVAGELAAMADEEGVRVEVLLLEQEPTVAPLFPENFQRGVREELLARGVTIRTGARVREATSEWIHTDEGEIAYDAFVWTGGITGDDAMDGDRPVVQHTLRLAGSTFAVGDAARVVDREGKPVPDSSQTAIRQAPVAAENVARLVEYRRDGGLFEPRLKSYTYDELGWVVSVGNGAVAQVGPTVWRGKAAKAMKTTIGAGYLSTIGAVRNAVDLVNQELGIADAVESDSPRDPEEPAE